MKKLVSLITILCMVMCCFTLPAAAEEPVVTVGTIAEGEVYAEGSDIILTASTTSDASTIKNIDFYADGEKISGTLTSIDDSLIWYSPAAGEYAVTAFVTYEGGGKVSSEPVNIEVKKEFTNVFKFDSPEDVKKATIGYYSQAVPTDENVSTDYAAYGAYSLHIKDISCTENGNNSITIDGFSVNVAADNKSLFIPIYSTADETLRININARVSGKDNRIPRVELKSGWNIYRIALAEGELTSLNISTFGYGLSDTATVTYDTTGQEYKDAEIYIGGAILLPTSVTALTALTATPEIGDGKDGVCNNIGKYRINFSEAINEASAAGGLTIKAGDAPVEGVTITAGADYIIANIPTPLVNNTVYTVEVSDKIVSKLGGTFEGATFTFTTQNTDCNPVPIPSVVYPAAGANVSDDTPLAAKVIFNGAVSKVEFFEEAGDTDTSLGEAIEYTDGEWQLQPETALTAGDHTIYASITYGEENTVISSSPITFTAASATEYAVHGIADGERILINDRPHRTVSVINAAQKNATASGHVGDNKDNAKTGFTVIPSATNVSKVTYTLNGSVRYTDTEAPYSWDMPLEKLGENANTLHIEVLDSFGKTTEFDFTYTALYGKVLNSKMETFEGENFAVSAANNLTNGSTEDDIAGAVTAEYSDGNIKGKALEISHYSWGTQANVQPLAHLNVPLQSDNDKSERFLRMEFDFKQTARYSKVMLQLRQSTSGSANFGTAITFLNESKALPYNKAYHITIDADFSTGIIVTYVDGVEFYRTSSSAIKTAPCANLVLFMQNSSTSGAAVCYLDNLSMTSYQTADAEIKLESDGSRVEAVNTTAEDYSFKVFNAAYDDDRLTSVELDNISLSAGSAVNREYALDPDSGRLFIWKDLEAMQPLKNLP